MHHRHHPSQLRSRFRLFRHVRPALRGEAHPRLGRRAGGVDRPFDYLRVVLCAYVRARSYMYDMYVCVRVRQGCLLDM